MKKRVTIGILSAAAGLLASLTAHASDLEEQLVRSRAVEAVIWSRHHLQPQQHMLLPAAHCPNH